MPRWAVLLALVALAGCSAGRETRGPDASAGSPPATASPDRELRTTLEAYVDCLRDEGVRASDPSFDGAGHVIAWPSYEPTTEALAAEESCGDQLAELAFRPRGEAAIFLEGVQDFVDCMKREGITDIEASIEGIRIGPRSSNSEIRSAERECRPYLEGA